MEEWREGWGQKGWWEGGRYGCQNDGLDEAGTVVETRREGRREGREGGREGGCAYLVRLESLLPRPHGKAIIHG
jgi:hypothetical protein